jgi:secernin
MCDSLVVVTEKGAWLAKNSDREPGEAQVVEHHERRRPHERTLATTYLELDQAAWTNETAISRPTWMWGAEMGVNEHGLAIGNEAVFTRVPQEETGLLGMDLVRLALERCASADDALDLMTWMLLRYGQGGPAGFRAKSFRYHNSFLIADARGAWVLETAGRFWAAQRVSSGVRTISNVLTIGEDYTRLGPGTIEGARSLGLLARGETFDFRKTFAAPVMGWLSGGDARRECTARAAALVRDPDRLAIMSVLRDHAGRSPSEGLRLVMPCAHASFLPTRGAGQTTATMVTWLDRERRPPEPYFTGTSAPCLSVLKPVPLGRGRVDLGPPPRKDGFDDASLFWRAERLHRTVLRDYDARRRVFEGERRELEARATTDAWAEHRARVLDWTASAAAVRPRGLPRPFDAYWRVQSRRDGIRP